MGITAKELAAMLGISPAAVSMALNDKPGVSEQTRRVVMEAAKVHGFDFSKIKSKPSSRGKLAFILYKKHGAVVADTSFFSELIEGITRTSKEHGYGLDIHYIIDNGALADELMEIAGAFVDGIILLGTEMRAADFAAFGDLGIPLVILDTYFEGVEQNYVLINNVQGAYIATNYMIHKRKCQPGYLRSSYAIGNFDERADGFYKAIRENGLSPSKSVVHELAPSVEGAYSDMCALLDAGESVASCYFSDNDLIAAGAMRAFKEHGYRIPQDIGIVGFDNTAMCELLEPPLTTINVPRQAMARVTVERLVTLINTPAREMTKTAIMTSLVKRSSL